MPRPRRIGGIGARRAAAERRGRLRGIIGVACYVDFSQGLPGDQARIEVAGEGVVRFLNGWQSSGQGHATVFAQLLADALGVPLDSVMMVQGDTATVAIGWGTGGSRSVVYAGPVVWDARAKIIAQGLPLAAELLEAAAADIAFVDGNFRVRGTDQAVELFAVAARAPGGRLAGEGVFRTGTTGETYPNGCHVCEIEIDPATGALTIERYIIANDFGTVINPRLVAGQIHGGTAQGLGQALCERAAYDAAGQMASTTFLHYALPRAADLPAPRLISNDVPCATNPLGIKGCGESGTIAAPAAPVASRDATAGRGPIRGSHHDPGARSYRAPRYRYRPRA